MGKIIKNKIEYAGGDGGGSDINVVQTTGNSVTDVMSQKAVTDTIFAPHNRSVIDIERKSGVSGIMIGYVEPWDEYDYYPRGENNLTVGSLKNVAENIYYVLSVGFGNSRQTEGNCFMFGHDVGDVDLDYADISQISGAIGHYTKLGAGGTISFGGQKYDGVNQNYRLINVADGVDNTDVATVAQGNKLMTYAPTGSDKGVLGQLWTDTTTMHTYQCTELITGSNPEIVLEYVWTQRW